MKNRIKKTVSLLLVVIMLLTSAPLAGVTDLDLFGMTEFFSISSKAIKEGSLTYKVENGKAMITDCDQYISGELVIPDTLGGYPVTSIDDFAFSNCRGLTSITIPSDVTSIRYGAFSGCTGITRINWNAESVSGFCESESPFSGVGAYGSGIDIVFSDNVKCIPAHLFSYDNIKSVTIGKNVTSIGEYAFNKCTGLTSITLPDSLTSIGNDAFSGCTGLTQINWNAENISSGRSIFSNAGTAKDGITVVFGDNVKSIPESAFEDCTGLTSITLPDSLTSIGEYAFSGCTELTSIIIPDSVTNIGRCAFDGTAWYSAQPFGDVYAGKVYYKYKGTMLENTTIEIKEGSKGIAGNAFYGCDGLFDISIPQSVTNIGEYAFSNCASLTELMIPESVKTIGDYAFDSCIRLNHIEIPESVKIIGSGAFRGCNSLAEVIIPLSVETIGNAAFENCYSLNHIEIPDSVLSIGDEAFAESAIRQIVIPDSVTYLGRAAFDGCSFLTSVTIGSGVKDIFGTEYNAEGLVLHYGTFHYCPNLTTIKIKKGVKTIEGYAFRGIKSIPDIYFEGSEEEWKEISIDQSNDMILRANMHYNADLSHEHSYTETVEEPTCTEAGLKTFTCSCGKTYTETIPAIGHNYQPVVVNPTCVSIGYETSTCQNCGVSYFIRAIPALGHTDTDNDGNCDRCGEKTGEPVDPPKPDDPSATCTHICHKGGISAFFYKIARFFWKLFKTNKYCSCGAAHY